MESEFLEDMTNHNKELREAILKKIKLDNHNNTNDTKHLVLNSSTKLQTMQGTMCSFSCGNWIYNYMCNECLSPLQIWVRIPLKARCARYNIM